MQASEARELLRALQAASTSCLDALNIPSQPRGKTRSWKGGRPTGVGFHYTGGTSGITAAKWFNKASLGNTSSSCHFLVFGSQHGQLRTLWDAHDVSKVFRVPVLQLAGLDRATWHMNWANSRVVGIENRNAGYAGYQRVPGGLAAMGKQPYKVLQQPQLPERLYEPYWREQIEANVMLCRVVHAAVSALDPEWLVGHSQIWATKADPGPAFVTMHEMRDMVFSGLPLSHHEDILGRFDTAPSAHAEVDGPLPDMSDADSRDDPGDTERAATWDVDTAIVGVPAGIDAIRAERLLYALGWPVYASTGDRMAVIRRTAMYFQRSTLAWAKAGKPERVLKVDGQIGKKTLAALEARVQELRLGL